MRILIVGAGGVGNAIAVGLARRDFFEHVVVADVALARAEATRDRVADDRVRRRRGRRVGPRPRSSQLRPGRTDRHDRERVRPPVQHADLRRRVRRRVHLPRHGDEPLEAPSRRAPLQDRRDARRRAVRPFGRVGGEGPARTRRDRRRARASPTSSPGTRPTTSSPRSTRSACATARTSPSTATRSRRRSRSGRRSRSASTRR